MTAHSTTCRSCSTTFDVTDDDLAFLDRISPVFAGKKELIPAPTLCPDCRLQRRLAHRNEKSLYHRACAKTGRQIISIYPPDAAAVVYEKNEWWGDSWSGMDYGRNIDFAKPFLGQVAELQRTVPRMSLQQENNQNSDYTSNVSHLKNCYLLFSADFSQDCAYGVWVERSRDSLDTFCIDECERCYECVFCQKLYGCRYALDSSQCSDCAFIFDCRGCKNCLMCWGLRNKEFCIANVQYTKDEYLKKLKEFPLSSHKNVEIVKKQFAQLLANVPRPHLRKHGTIIDSTGDLLQNCGNCKNCYELREGRDCVNTIGFQATDARDCSYVMGEFAYENCECFPTPTHSAFNLNSYTGNDLYYCDMCMLNCKNCFGCVGLKRAQYCILNKQYTKEEYEALVPKIIESMKKDGSWGEYFPMSQSLFGYNISEAQQYFPMKEAEAKKQGLGWTAEDKQEKKAASKVDVPDDIAQVDDKLTENILTCEVTGKAYKVIPQELKFYKELGIPVPRKCPDQRHAERMKQRNPRHLWDRQCANCKKPIQTTYSNDRSEIVYCEECYLKKVY